MAKKDETILYLAVAAAVVGYLVFKKGGALNLTPIPTAVTSANASYSSPAGIAIEQPTLRDLNVIAPQLDPTGMQIDFM